jgi:hypothetical protein
MNIRTFLNYIDGYYKINREERNLTAILYHLLLLDDNLKLFLQKINNDFPINDSEMGIYFEYSYLRDLWNNIRNDNDTRMKLILEFLKPVNSDALSNMDVVDFNKYFGAKSESYIESPGNWSIRNYDKTIIENDEFLKVCKFKWCFNIKPDIVIHTSNDSAFCIEAKFESKEGQYPSGIDKQIFRRRMLHSIGQLSIQKKLMEELLGLQTDFIFLVQKKSESNTHKTFTWQEVFQTLDSSNAPFFILEWLKKWN